MLFMFHPDPFSRSLHPPYCVGCSWLTAASSSKELPSSEQKPPHPDYITVHHHPQAESASDRLRVHELGSQGGAQLHGATCAPQMPRG